MYNCISDYSDNIHIIIEINSLFEKQTERN